MPSKLLDLDMLERTEQQQAGPAITLVKEAPPTPSMPEGFAANLRQELGEGVGRISQGFEQPGVLNTANAGLGMLQAIDAPVTAAARTAGQATQDAFMGMGFGPTASAVPATIVDTAIQALGGPALGRIMRGTARQLARVSPGFWGASRQAKRELIAGEAEGLPSLIKQPNVDTDQIYKQIDGLATRIPVDRLEDITKQLARVEAKLPAHALRNPPLTSLTSDLQDAINTARAQGGLPFGQLRLTLKRLNDRIQGMGEAKDELYGAYMQLKRGIFEDMENTRVIYKQGGMLKDAYTELRKADAAYRAESAVEDLGHFVSKAMTYSKGALSFNADAVLNNIRHDKFFRDSLPDESIKKLEETLKSMSRKTPARPPTLTEHALISGTLSGSTALTAWAGGVGPALTAPQFLGGMTGVLGLITIADIVIGQAMTKPAGQAMLKTLFKRDRLVTPEKLAALSGVIRTGVEYSNVLSKPGEQEVRLLQ